MKNLIQATGFKFPDDKIEREFCGKSQKSDRVYISSKNFVKAVSFSIFIGRYSLCELQSSCKKPNNEEMIFCDGDCRDRYQKLFVYAIYHHHMKHPIHVLHVGLLVHVAVNLINLLVYFLLL